MFVPVFGAVALMLAQAAVSTESAAQSASANQSASAPQQMAQAKPKPEMKRVCSKLQGAENSRAPQKHCWMEPVKAAPTEVAEAPEAEKPK